MRSATIIAEQAHDSQFNRQAVTAANQKFSQVIRQYRSSSVTI